jgi:hypothetical protein
MPGKKGGRSGLDNAPWQAKNEVYSRARDAFASCAKYPGDIAMIDMGQVVFKKNPNGFKHKDFAQKLAEPHKLAKPSVSGHAMEVAGILATWCDATIQHYNVWSEEGLDLKALIAALEDVVAKRPAVLNLSIGIDQKHLDDATRDHQADR